MAVRCKPGLLSAGLSLLQFALCVPPLANNPNIDEAFLSVHLTPSHFAASHHATLSGRLSSEHRADSVAHYIVFDEWSRCRSSTGPGVCVCSASVCVFSLSV